MTTDCWPEQRLTQIPALAPCMSWRVSVCGRTGGFVEKNIYSDTLSLRKFAGRWTRGAAIVQKRGPIARVWASIGRNGMALRDEASHGTPGPYRLHVSVLFSDCVLWGSPQTPEVLSMCNIDESGIDRSANDGHEQRTPAHDD